MEGFLVHAWPRTRGGHTVLYLVGRLSDGRTFAAMERRFRPWFCVRRSEAEAARTLANAAEWEQAGLTTMDGEPCLKALFDTADSRQKARVALAAAGLRTYEADLRIADQFRMERRIHGSLRLRGPIRPGRRVDMVFFDPEVEPSDWPPVLAVLSLDIETDVASGAVLAAGLSHRDPFREDREEVLYAGGFLPAGQAHDPAIRVLGSEAELLSALAGRIRELDPDVITGWNVVDFDLRSLSERFRLHGLPFRIGRSEEEAAYLPASGGRASRAVVPGRQVWDAVRLLRAAPERYEDYTLETVAETLLGHGKRLTLAEGEKRLDALGRLAREDPEEFCRYCLQDARLVQEIFDKTGLVELTLRRCQLLGVAPDLAWTSIPAFEHLYIEAMHERGVAAPTAGVDALPLGGAPGGGILTPQPGVYDRVLLFDFRSLYPSIIRSFNIDPLSYLPPGAPGGAALEEPEGAPSGAALEEPEGAPGGAPAEAGNAPGGQAAPRSGPIVAPNGARFRREPAILPQLLDRFFDSRRLARESGDEVASFVYKIIMNSFYGVLGAPGCRFAGSELAGAVTSFGQHILTWCRDFLEGRGYRVIYGDTDSLFVLQPPADAPPADALPADALPAGVPPAQPPFSAERLGAQLAAEVNAELEGYLRGRWRVQPRLLLEFEKVYERFFLPPMRGEEAASRGRAKSYAGLEALPEGRAGEEAQAYRPRIEVKGMEAVRRDWTDLAHEFQLHLLELLFRGAPTSAFREHIAAVVQELQAGRLDAQLVYRKALRKPVAEYTRNTPPHVKAAELLEPGSRRGLIRYLITVAGPQPAGRLSAPIDYGHYVEKQLKPIASAFTEVLGTDLQTLFGAERQLSLF